MNRKLVLWGGLTAVLLLCVSVIAQARHIEALNHSIRANSMRALYESAEMLRSVEVNLRKVAVSSSGAQMQEYLSDIARQTQGAESAVAALPVTTEHTLQATRALNQMGDYSSLLAKRLARGGAVTADDMENLGRMISASDSIRQGVLGMIETWESGGDIGNVSFNNLPEAGSVSSADGEYPTLIYDGPFSDSADTPLQPEGEPVSREQAEEILKQYMGDGRIRSVRFLRQSDIPSASYEFSMSDGSMEMTAAVTRKGGHVLYVLPEGAVESAMVAVPQCIASARQFLERNGYGGMHVSYSYHYQNVLTINFAARQGEILLYPDLIKVQVSMQDGRVIGVECSNYLKNHRQRNLPEVQISRDEVLARVNPNLQTQFIRLALIPLDAREYLTYEIAAQDANGNQYLTYTDAVTGQERQIFQLLMDENGTLAE